MSATTKDPLLLVGVKHMNHPLLEIRPTYRAAFADAATSAAKLATRLEGSNPEAPYNMENLLLCATMDMIGKRPLSN